VKEAEADEQHERIFCAPRVVAPKWEFEQINFFVGNCGSVVENNFYNKPKSLMYNLKKERKTNFAPIM